MLPACPHPGVRLLCSTGGRHHPQSNLQGMTPGLSPCGGGGEGSQKDHCHPQTCSIGPGLLVCTEDAPLQANTFVPRRGLGKIKGSPPQADLNPVTSETHPYPNGEDKDEVNNHNDDVCHPKGYCRVPRQRGQLRGGWGCPAHGCERTADFLSHTGLWCTSAFISALVIINRVEKV